MPTDGLTGHHLDPEALVARMMEELHAKPEAQRMLLRTLLTNEFRGMRRRGCSIWRRTPPSPRPTCLAESDVAGLKTNTATVVDDGDLKGPNLEVTVERPARGAR